MIHEKSIHTMLTLMHRKSKNQLFKTSFHSGHTRRISTQTFGICHRNLLKSAKLLASLHSSGTVLQYNIKTGHNIDHWRTVLLPFIVYGKETRERVCRCLKLYNRFSLSCDFVLSVWALLQKIGVRLQVHVFTVMCDFVVVHLYYYLVRACREETLQS